MPWVKFDDQYHQSRKLRRAGREAMWVHFTVTVFCARHLTDGYIDPTDIEAIAYDAMLPEKRVREAFTALEAVGALHVLGEGWTVHDYAEFQPTRETVMERREKWRQEQSKRRSKGMSA